MTSITRRANSDALGTYTLTDEHATSSYGVPVMIDAAGRVYGAGDEVDGYPAWEVSALMGPLWGQPDDPEWYAMHSRFTAQIRPQLRAEAAIAAKDAMEQLP